jgi:3-oxoacid CoA-transferase B subunit
MAELAASLLPEGAYVNLGLGIPSYLSSYSAGRHLILHGENGILGYGEIVPDDQMYPDVFNASGYPVTPSPGISYFDSVTAFEMVRGGRVDAVVLGAYQVDAEGSFTNWQTDGMVGGGIGGAMDLVASGRTVMVMMEHRDSRDRPKVVQRCSYALTGKSCVDILVTDLAQFRRKDGGLAVEQVWVHETGSAGADRYRRRDGHAGKGRKPLRERGRCRPVPPSGSSGQSSRSGRPGHRLGHGNLSRERRPVCRTSTVARRRSGTPSRGQGSPC